MPSAINAVTPPQPARPLAARQPQARAHGFEGDSMTLSGALLGGLAGGVGASAASGLLRLNPVVTILGAIGLGAYAGAEAFGQLKETAVGRHPKAAAVGAMAAGGAAAIGALTLGVTSGALVAGAAAVGAVVGVIGLARVASALLD
ncbi:MAG: hypothetical protein VKS61_11585 [Candidatus Sericytochromatia bacterium]|nr:hypothetical protein [Candidatus Sericytochromatia bacterium]